MPISPPPFLPRDMGNEVLFTLRRETKDWSNERQESVMAALAMLMEMRVPSASHKGDTETVSVLIARAFGHSACHHCAWECDLCTPKTCGNCDCLYV